MQWSSRLCTLSAGLFGLLCTPYYGARRRARVCGGGIVDSWVMMRFLEICTGIPSLFTWVGCCDICSSRFFAVQNILAHICGTGHRRMVSLALAYGSYLGASDGQITFRGHFKKRDIYRRAWWILSSHC